MRRLVAGLVLTHLLIPSLSASEGNVLVVRGAPQAAVVYVDDERVGTSPLEIDLSPGTYGIRIEAERFHPYEQVVEVSGRTELAYELKRRVATVTVTSDPPGAKLLIDGIDFGTTPRDVRLYHGGHVVEYSRPEYTVHECRIVVEGDGIIDLEFSDLATPAFLSVKRDALFPDGETVWVDGRILGTTPIELAPVYGTTIEVSVSGVTETISVQPGHHYVVIPRTPVPLEARPGRRVDIDGLQDVAPKPKLLPEYRITRSEEVRLSVDAPTLIAGTVLSLASGAAVGLAAATDSASPRVATLLGAAFATAAELAVTAAAVSRERVEPYTRVTLSRNVRANRAAIEAWERSSRAAIEHNRGIVGQINAERGTLTVRHAGQVLSTD